jgi:hypothetical protein
MSGVHAPEPEDDEFGALSGPGASAPAPEPEDDEFLPGPPRAKTEPMGGFVPPKIDRPWKGTSSEVADLCLDLLMTLQGVPQDPEDIHALTERLEVLRANAQLRARATPRDSRSRWLMEKIRGGWVPNPLTAYYVAQNGLCGFTKRDRSLVTDILDDFVDQGGLDPRKTQQSVAYWTTPAWGGKKRPLADYKAMGKGVRKHKGEGG